VVNLLISLSDEITKAQNTAAKGAAKRGAVLDKGEQVENYNGEYVPKVTVARIILVE
jgi:hypothetical protein